MIVGACLSLLACRGSDKGSPLILGRDGKDAAPGLRTLSGAQTRALQRAITSAGESCAEVEQTYLREAEPELATEWWSVRCVDGAYSVRMAADREQTIVQPCVDRSFRGVLDDPCSQRFPDRRASPRLNPELGKLLEPLSAPDGKKSD